VKVNELFRDGREIVRYYALDAGAALDFAPAGGLELLLLSGSVQDGEDRLHAGDWLRLPEGEALTLSAGPDGATLWMKTGHLRFVAAPDS